MVGIAAVDNVSLFDAYIRYNMMNWGNNIFPFYRPAANGTDTIGQITGGSGTQSGQLFSLAWTNPTSNPPNWGHAIFAYNSSPNLFRTNLKLVLPISSVSAVIHSDLGIQAGGDAYFKIVGLNKNGSHEGSPAEIHVAGT